jgi:hypothetical protein
MRSTLPGPPPPELMAQLWVEPSDLTARDLFRGPGGAALAPPEGARFHFLRKNTSGYSWGWDLKDESGAEWSVKYGPEAQSEVVVSRLLWAIGYHQLPTYYVRQWELVGSTDVPQPSRFRLKPKGWHRAKRWSWHRNPFVGTPPFNGLLVFMRVVDNWDLVESNNAVYDLDSPAEGARRWYVVRDLGASLGRTLIWPHSGTRNNVDDFVHQGFIKHVRNDGSVQFDDLGRAHRDLFGRLSAADVAWACGRLARLTDRQLADAFRAADYDEEQAARFIGKIRQNVASGLALVPAAADSQHHR